MAYTRVFYLLLLCVALSFATGCGKKGIPCPSPNGKSMKVSAKGSGSMEAIKVPYNKDGRVQKRKRFLFF
ncbi:hypothetical protein H8S95_17420 [Pontibacter sp. KCTC 32443]|uniref:hypothetical protein n=1 Tax=Pontibacter TaxID=323449 RepID=UPI00164E2AB5|nr:MULTISPECIES: hypothetical protein [Pontibacter]MBC5775859.1 hypothetical protein [Pontibacter sp. KCTC 32443]